MLPAPAPGIVSPHGRTSALRADGARGRERARRRHREVWRGLDGEPSRLVERDELVPDRRCASARVTTRCRGSRAPRAATTAATTRWRSRRSRRSRRRSRAVLASRARAGRRRDGHQHVGRRRRRGGDSPRGAPRRPRSPTFDYAQLEFGGLAAFVAELLGVRGPAYALSTACSSGARALASARSLLALGRLRRGGGGRRRHAVRPHRNGFGALGDLRGRHQPV